MPENQPLFEVKVCYAYGSLWVSEAKYANDLGFTKMMWYDFTAEMSEEGQLTIVVV